MSELPAGRELDQEIAIKVFGWGWHTRLCQKWLGRPEEVGTKDPIWGTIRDAEGFDNLELEDPWWLQKPIAGVDTIVPCYSTDIGAAWQIVEHMANRGLKWYSLWRDSVMSAGGTEQWGALFSGKGQRLHGTGDTAPLAICRAALSVKALEEKEG